jgi:DNA/RNA endonuclease G (NUC1)
MNVRRSFVLLVLCLVTLAPMASAASSNVVISQVYGGGGNSGAQYRNDYIELFNRGTAPVNLSGWSVQYASSAGTTWQVTALNGTIQPGQYYLVQEAAGASTTAPLLPAPNAIGTIPMSASAGKVALVASTAALTGSCPAAVDFVGFGGANCSETAPTAGLSNTTAARRTNACVDADNNAAEFAVGAPLPRNSSTTESCDSNAAPTITAPANPAATVSQDAAPFTIALTGSDDSGPYNWSATPGTGIASVTVGAGQGTPNATFQVTLTAGFSGSATFTASLSDGTLSASQAVNISVTPLVANDAPAIAPIANPVLTVAQDAAPFTIQLSGSDDNDVFNWSATNGAGVSSAVVTSGQGTANATYTVALQPGFSGTASFTARLSDNVNPNVTQLVTITVTPAPPPPLDHLVISQIYGGGGNSGATFRNDYVELYNPTTSAVDVGGWTIQYASSTGTSWQAQPLGGIMQPGEYYLIQLASGGAVGALLPVSPNVAGDINMSGTTGKVALVAAGDALAGSCPLADVVDLVGYGTANCREGASNAPAPSNTIAIFRKNGGFTDTNGNGADFVTGAPNPRRTTPIVEIGPYVLNVDPRNTFSNVPRDASLTITFTETVDVTGAWFTITCATTGEHTDATVAQVGRSWIVTPNASFLAGEQCSVTLNKNLITDTDLDDSAPGTDNLNTNYSWSFTIATGAAPSYTPDVHLTMGNPTDAETDLFTPDNYLMEKPEFTLSYNRSRGIPNWVSWHLADEWVGTLARVDTFRPDPAVPADWYRVLHTDYQSSGFDRGHMVPNADRDPADSSPINQATFLMTNMIPQAPDNNQGPWANMENYLRTLLPANELYIVAGGAGTGGTGSGGFTTTIANGNVTVPAQTWKVVVVIPKASGDDVARVQAGSRTIAVIMPNTQGIRTTNPNDWQAYLTSIDAVEALTGYDFYENVSDAIENAIEGGVNGVNPPGVANQSVSTDEDVVKTFTLEAANPGSNALTYTILTPPSNGTLSGTGATQTYTPGPNFNGTDAFTFKACDGSLCSGIAAVHVIVYEVNDAPEGSASAPPAAIEGTSVTATATATDVEGDALTMSWTVTKNGAPFASGSGSSVTFTPNDDGSYVATVSISDGTSNTTASATTVVSNAVPVIGAVAGPSASMPIGSAATVSATYGDAGAADTHTAVFTWNDGTSSTVSCSAGVCAATKAYTAAGVYTVNVVVSDDDGGVAGSSFSSVIVTDASAGFVTGGGFIVTPAGKATLNVNAKYVNGQSAPIGNTQFKLAGYDFTSTSYAWLVVSGSTAQYSGLGTVNGAGSYGFEATVVDGSPDAFRIRIWDTVTNAVIYDNGAPQTLGGGNVTVHH